MKRFYFFIFLFSSFFLFSDIGLVEAETLYAWAQLSDSDSVSIRAIMKDNDVSCPLLLNGKNSYSMNKRSLYGANGFTSAVCEKTIKYGECEGKTSLGCQTLFVNKKENIRRILLIGDTGCNINKDSWCAQDCKNEDFYFLKKNVQAALSHKPDVVIHLGDYIYAKTECGSEKLCGGLPYGDNMKNWESEFINTFYPLMNSAVSIFVRGNHELCHGLNSGLGWSLFFKDGDNIECEEREKLSVFDIGIARFFGLDTAGSAFPKSGKKDNLSAARIRAEKFLEDQMQKIIDYKNSGEDNNFLITHRPFIAFSAYNEGNEVKIFSFSSNSLSDIKSSFVFPEKINAVISGHFHDLTLIGFDEPLPVQIISGGGGASSSNKLYKDFNDFDKIYAKLNQENFIQGNKIGCIESTFGYGFMIMDHLGGAKWTIKAYDQNNNLKFEYIIDGKNIHRISK